MNIWLCPSAYYPSLGGVEELTRKLAATLVKKGFTLQILTHKLPNAGYTDNIDNIILYRFHFHLPARKIYNMLRFAVFFPLEMSRLVWLYHKHKPDIIHIQCTSGHLHYLRILACMTKTPLLITTQGETVMDSTQIYQDSSFLRKVLRKGLKQADHVTACSKATLDEINEQYLDVSCKSSVIYNGIEPNEFEVAVTPVPDRYIFATGRLTYNKGFDLLIKAFSLIEKKYPELKLFIGGSGECENELANQIMKLNLSAKIILLGRLDRLQTVSFMKNSMFVVMPSRYEPFGIVALEAMAAGKAILATNKGGPPEFVSDRKNGLLVDPSDVGEFTEKLEEMLGKYQIFETGNIEYAKNFSWDNISEQYIKIYRKIKPLHLVFISLENWDEIWRRNQFFAARMMRDFKVSFLTPEVPFYKFPKSRLRHFNQINIYSLRKFLPERFQTTRLWNQKLYTRQIKNILKQPIDILWINDHSKYFLVDKLAGRKIIYDITDDWTKARYKLQECERVLAADRYISDKSDAIIVCSQVLKETKKSYNEKTTLIKNGVDLFAYQTNETIDMPMKKPVLMYTGTVHEERIDLPLVLDCATSFPDCSFVFVGPIYLLQESLKKINLYSNIFLLGPVAYQDIPKYQNSADILIVPHLMTDFTQSLDPIKQYEYLCSSKPVISTSVSGFTDFRELFSVVSDNQTFKQAINDHLNNKIPLFLDKRLREAEKNSWDSRYEEVKRLLYNI
ncbi:MAG: glycosyltransferase [Candidatus Margulisbacteria bacterium]|nr:glycosyltransferase [Candidatus Margulisiibacteriota bacterium]